MPTCAGFCLASNDIYIYAMIHYTYLTLDRKPTEKLHHRLFESVLYYINLSHVLYILHIEWSTIIVLVVVSLWILFLVFICHFFMCRKFSGHHCCNVLEMLKNGNGLLDKKAVKHLLCIYHTNHSRIPIIVYKHSYFVLCVLL